MKKHRILSIFMAFCIMLTSSFMNISSAATVEYLGELTTDEMLLSELIYDDYILKQKYNEKINIKNYTEFYGKCRAYIDRGDIMYESLDQLNNRLSKYTLKMVERDKVTGFEGAVFERDYNGKRHLTIVFRGTEMDKLNDLTTDFLDVFIPIFKNQANVAKRLVKNAIKLNTSSNPIDEISITGHSLGGFLAQCVGVEIAQNNIEMSNINWNTSTFNAPGLWITPKELSKSKNISSKEINEYLDYVNSLDKNLKSYSKIKNYYIDGDIVGEYGKHAGQEFRYENHASSLTKYHSLYNFHKYGNWYKTSTSKTIIKSVYENDTEVKGVAPANKNVELYINNKQVKSMYTNDRGEYKFTIGKQSAGSKIEVIYVNSYGNYVSTTITVKNPLKVNKIYYGKKTITGEAIPYGKVEVYLDQTASAEEAGILSKTTADKYGKFTLNLPRTYSAGTKFKVRTSKAFYPRKSVSLSISKSNISTLTINKLYSATTSLSGKTISNAKVTAYKNNKKIGSTVTSDKNGNFKISIGKQSKGSKIKVVARKSNYNDKESTITVTQSPTATLSVSPKYYNSKTISGKATPGATVEAYYGNTKLGKVVADKSGNYKISTNLKIKVGKTITVRASKTNYYSKETKIKVQNSKIFDLTTSNFYTYNTTISGKTTPGATVKAYVSKKQVGKTATADKNGNYKITGIKKQSAKKVITVKATKKDYISKSVNITVKAASTVRLPFISKGKVGYMDETGRVAIKPQFKYFYSELDSMMMAGEFYNNRAQVYTSLGKTRYIDTNGKYINNYTYDYGFDFSENMAVAYRNGKFRFINTAGKEVFSTKYTVHGCFRNGLVIYTHNGKDGYMDKNGKIVIKAQYADAKSFYNGYALVELTNGQTAIIDKKGKNKTEGYRLGYYLNNYSYDQPVVSEGMFALYGEGYVFADINNPSKIKIYNKIGSSLAGFDDVGIFTSGLAPVKTDGKWGYIDKKGKMVIKPTYDFAGNFEGNYSTVYKGNYIYVIDKSGKVVSKKFKYSYEGSAKIDHKLMAFNNSSGYKYYDFKGNLVKPKI